MESLFNVFENKIKKTKTCGYKHANEERDR